MPVTGSGRLSTFLDVDMLITQGAILYAENVPDARMPVRSGVDVAAELGGRLLLSYLRASDVQARSTIGTAALGPASRRVYATPTSYSPREVISALALPYPRAARTHVLLLDPAEISGIQGPRRVICGYRIEYLLPGGYPASALRLPWERVID